MQGQHSTIRLLACWLLVSCAHGQHTLAQESVRLRDVVSLPPEREATLADIALVEGPGASKLEAIAIPQKAWTRIADSDTRTIDVAMVRSILAASPDVNLGRIALSGSRVERQPPARMHTATSSEGLANEVAKEGAGISTDAPLIRHMLAPRLAHALGMDISDIRVELDEGDSELLNTPTTGRTVTITPMGESDRPPMHVRVYEGDRLVVAKSTRADVLVRRDAVLATRAIRRGELLDPSLLRVEERWLAPSVPVGALADLVGRAARVPIASGSIVQRRDAEEPIVVRKGERIVVDCMVEGVLVRSTMRATSTARVGEVILVEPLVRPVRGRSAQKETASSLVFARIQGPGRGVVTTSDAATPSETQSEQVREPAQQHQAADHAAASAPYIVVRRAGLDVMQVAQPSPMSDPTGTPSDQVQEPQ